jgi:DNA processing protein
VSEVSGEERLARAALTYVAEPGDPIMGALLRTCAPAEIVAALIQGRAPMSGATPDDLRRPGRDSAEPVTDSGGPAGDDGAPGEPVLPGLDGLSGSPGPSGLPGLDRALRLWAARLGEVPAAPALEAWRQGGIRLVCPGEPESNLPYT